MSDQPDEIRIVTFDAIEFRKARPDDFPALGQMLELYRYELPDMWEQTLGADGRYGYGLTRHADGLRFHAHVALVDSRYAGFALVAPATVTRREGFWMEQFFVLKRYRRGGVGAALAEHVFRNHPGTWEVGQMPANVAARTFWRHVIACATQHRFVEVNVTEGWWQGTVQQFDVGGGSGA